MGKDFSIDPELIQHVKDGHEEYFPILWNKVKGFVHLKATRVLASSENNGVDRDDLEQAGRIALWKTVQSYDSEKGKFFYLFTIVLKTEFANACRYRTQKQKDDAFRGATTLDKPIGEEDEGFTLQDVIPDEESSVPFEEIERRVWNRELHEALEQSMRVLPDRNTEIIRRHYFENQVLKDIANTLDVSIERVRQMEVNSFRKLKRQKELKAFVEQHTPTMSKHVGIKWFRQTNTSSVEWLVLEREKLMHWYLQRETDAERISEKNFRENSLEYSQKVREIPSPLKK